MRINPCVEDVKNMKSSDNGRFCNSCNKVIVDLTRKSNLEILDIYHQNNGNLCGIVNPNQLSQRKYYHPLKRFALALMLVFGSTLFVFGNNLHKEFEPFRMKILSQINSDTTRQKVNGFIYVNQKPYQNNTVMIFYKDSVFDIKTDQKGAFKFDLSMSINDLDDLTLEFKIQSYSKITKYLNLNMNQFFMGKITFTQKENKPILVGEIMIDEIRNTEEVSPIGGGIAPPDINDLLFD